MKENRSASIKQPAKQVLTAAQTLKLELRTDVGKTQRTKKENHYEQGEWISAVGCVVKIFDELCDELTPRELAQQLAVSAGTFRSNSVFGPATLPKNTLCSSIAPFLLSQHIQF